jgi:hypothetical protein
VADAVQDERGELLDHLLAEGAETAPLSAATLEGAAIKSE